MGKKLIIVLLILVIVVLCVKLGASYLTKQTLKKVTIQNVDVARLANGEYEGTAKISPVSAKVNVLVNEGKIASIKIEDHMTGLGKDGEQIVNKIIDEQSLKVDAISSATQSSVTIIKAVEDALFKE